MSTATSCRRGNGSGAADCTRRRGCDEKTMDSPKSALLQWYWSRREVAAPDAMSEDAAEVVLEQLDAQWFSNSVFRRGPKYSSCPNSPVVRKEIQTSHAVSESDDALPRWSSRRLSDGDHHLRRHLDRRLSDISNTSLDQSSFSHLTRVTEDEEMTENVDLFAKILANRPPNLTTINPGRGRPRRRLKGTKSLTDLEYEELRGFKDLGFEVSTGDLTPHAVRMFPGLQRQGIPPYNSPLGGGDPRGTSSSGGGTHVLPQHVLWPRRPNSPRVDMKGQLKSWASEMANIVSIEC